MNFQTIINLQQLAPKLDDPSWVIVDTRFDLMSPNAGHQAYQAGHIPHAYYAHLDYDLSSPMTKETGRHPLPDIERFTSLVQRWGVSSNSQVVVYDHHGGAIAARLWWLFKWLGHQNVAVMDGGLKAWEAGGYPLSTQPPGERQGDFSPEVNDALWVSTDHIYQKVNDNHFVLLDVRDVDRFNGRIEPIDHTKGHIPGAINLPFKASLDQWGYFLPQETLLSHFAGFARSDKVELVCMCGSGVTACHSILALTLAGIPNAKLYAGSWSEWIQDPGRPVTEQSD